MFVEFYGCFKFSLTVTPQNFGGFHSRRTAANKQTSSSIDRLQLMSRSATSEKEQTIEIGEANRRSGGGCARQTKQDHSTRNIFMTVNKDSLTRK
jgi:aminoglycoside phosphotransferase family enzyme